MSAIGRNDPCPCGSGKKYKRCCLQAASPPVGAYTQGERESALLALARFGSRHEFDDARAAAETRFWGGVDSLVPLLPDAEQPSVTHQGDLYFQDWFTTDYRVEGDRTLLELFLEREERRLRPGEARYLGRARLTHLRPYEVTGVALDEGLDLLDLWADTRIRVQERLATRQVVQWDMLAARVMLGSAGVPVLDGVPYLYPARAKDAIMKDLRRLHRRFRRRVPGDDVDFFKRFGSVFFLWWIQHAVLPARLQFRTVEGDDMISARAVFDVRDRETLERALAGHPELDRQDDGSYAWYEPGGTDEFRRGFGTFLLDAGRIVLETTSKPRAERGRAFLEALAGEAVRYRTTSLESVERALARAPAKRAEESTAIPPEVEAEIVQTYYDQHYRTWPDTPLPALGGKTPREAAASRAGRPRLVALLKDMESHAARERLTGRPAYDFRWMWAELGLERPG